MYINTVDIMKNKRFCILTNLLLLASLTGCQTSMDKQYNYIDPKKGRSVICYKQEDSIFLSKRAYTDNHKASKDLGLYPKIRDNSCKIVKTKELFIVDYYPKKEFRLSDEGLDSYYSPIHQLKKVKYNDEIYWLVR
jgi:hypothetical protein